MLIALLTDFGTSDYFVGAMKGVILSINPDAKIVDISHEIEPQSIRSAGFTLASCYRNFPPKTIFVAVVDPGVGSDRQAILVETERHYFLAPDNGLLGFVLANESNYRVITLKNPRFFLPEISRTFHGRDLFAPVAAWLSNGIDPREFGETTKNLRLDDSVIPKRLSRNEIQGQIIHIDRFGNLVTNFNFSDLPKNFTLQIRGFEISKHNAFYAEANLNELFSICGSAGYLEIAANCNSAQNILNAEIGEKILLKLR